VRLAQVSMIPASKRALMEDRKARDAAEDALKAVEKDLKRSARSAATAGVPAAATEGEGLQELTTGPDGRPRATLSL
jgi:hypothetical protein